MTDENGNYTLTNLPIGPYRLQAMLSGFRTFQQTGIVLTVNANPEIAIELGLGALTETVSVEAATPLVETRSPSLGSVIDNERIEELPLNGRNATDLCPTTQVCSQRTCAANCATGETECNSACVNVQTDSLNCGTCGVQCSGGRICQGGSCVCPSNSTECGTPPLCVNIESSPANCGACNARCPSGEICDARQCACPGGFQRCGGTDAGAGEAGAGDAASSDSGSRGACVNTRTDPNNCGSCGNMCEAGRCMQSQCN